ncbi:DUF4245 domain-containing protein [Micromonospora costi]|uniref:DUF4245 domain-containing protein n=1 Tax=Micromonospora costi TaxID=1530042 RepID=A0A3B0ADH7_9ACTN|nr:DUF4245 domain-containing protein [Micromonospora costi]RKN58364.1 DUF4245 domain-containing protein [Micromonospora costi]
MEPAQPADRVPSDPTPTGPDAAGGPALAEPTGGTAPGRPAGDAALVPGTGEAALVEPAGAARAGSPAVTREPGEIDPPAPPPSAEARRSDRSPKDMAISLLVLLVPIALLLAFYRGFLGGDQANAVDPAPAIEQAQAANAFPVSQPAGLGDDWRTVSARYQTVDGGANLRLGYLTPEGRGAQLVQSNLPAERLLPSELTDQAQPQGQTDLAGRNWQRYTARANEQALVLLEPGRTVIVVGDARESELRQLAGSLR